MSRLHFLIEFLGYADEKVTSPYLFVLTVFAMGTICWYSNSPHLIAMPYSLLGLLFVAFGIALAGRSSALFRKVGTNIMTFDEPESW